MCIGNPLIGFLLLMGNPIFLTQQIIDPTLFGLNDAEISGINNDVYLGKVLESYFKSFMDI